MNLILIQKLLKFSFYINFKRLFGYGPKNEKVTTFRHKFNNKTYTLLACISAFGVLYFEILETTKCGINAERFEAFLRNMLLWVPDSSILILDNCRIHHSKDIIGLLDSLEVKYLFLGPYSPEMNPIEYFFAFIKLKVKNNQYNDVRKTIEDAIEEVTETHLKGWIELSKRFWDANSL